MCSMSDVSEKPASAAGSCCPACPPQHTQIPPQQEAKSMNPPRETTSQQNSQSSAHKEHVQVGRQPGREGGRHRQDKNTWMVLTCSHLPAEATCCQTACFQIREIRELGKWRKAAAAAASGYLEGKTAPPRPQQVQHQHSTARLAKPACHPLLTFPRSPGTLQGLPKLFARSSLVPWGSWSPSELLLAFALPLHFI